MELAFEAEAHNRGAAGGNASSGDDNVGCQDHANGRVELQAGLASKLTKELAEGQR
jgi:hypothetical protein